MAKWMKLDEAVQSIMKNGYSVAFEGFTHLIPHAAAHEVIRQAYRELTLIRMTPDLVYDQMIGMGCAKKLIFSYAGNPGVGLLRRLRDSIEKGWPNRIEIEEHSHAAMANAYEAGAANLPFAVFRGYVGVELPSVLASSRSIVTVEEKVEDLNPHPNAVVLPHWAVDAICLVPGGAHPSYAHGYYERDNAAYLAWDQIATEREGFLKWMDEYVIRANPEDFEARVHHLRRLA